MNIVKMLFIPLLFGVLGCSAQEPISLSAAPVSTDGLQSTALFGAVNRARSSSNLGPLSQNSQLQQTAQAYAETLARAGRIAHSGIDGTTLRNRVDASGYQYRTFNENLSAGYPTADLVVEGWMNSPGHRTNLLNPEISEVGVGYARANQRDKWVHYWVMVGGAPR